MYEQAEPVRSPFSGPDSRQTSGPPKPRPVRQSGSRERVRHGNGASDNQREDAEEVKRYASSADRTYPGRASGRRGVCSFLRARRSCLAAGIAVLLSLSAVGLAPLTFSNKQEISQLSTAVDALKRQLSTTVDALKRDQDDMSATVDALKRDQDDMSTTVDALKRDQDDMSATVDALKRDLDNERNRIATLEQRLHEIENGKTLDYTKWRGICYKVFNTLKTFSEAAGACREDGGTLAMPRDADINTFLIALCKSVSDAWAFWFGLHDQRVEGSYEWVDGSPLGSYNSWAPGEPSNFKTANGDQDCVLFSKYRSQKGMWHDHGCHLRFYFICQTAP
ncbi:PREDICTED: C-type lectin domain family 4 member F-like, partial [Branchiostoma belcheri]|uniref:C-type lectin domain family 4 member F-like n=1 Tax=Branchiostoma belcheri TaxID=7741 RepID=A0A6P4ZZ38_BRABE